MLGMLTANTTTSVSSQDAQISTTEIIPTGTLVNANATATVTSASLTTSLVDTTITFAWSFAITLWQKYAIVLNQVGDVVNATNYYGVGYVDRNTTTRLSKIWNGSVWSAIQTNIFPYTSSTLALPTVLSKTSASFTYKLPTDFPRIANEAKSAGQNVITTYLWLKWWFTGLSNTTYYASNTPWLISVTPWTNVYAIWEWIDSNTLNMINTLSTFQTMSGTTVYLAAKAWFVVADAVNSIIWYADFVDWTTVVTSQSMNTYWGGSWQCSICFPVLKWQYFKTSSWWKYFPMW